MRIAIVATGDELLRGELVDSNSAWLSEQFARAGWVVRTHLTVGDDLPRLVATVDEVCREHDVVVFTGGLGPTQDDYTVAAVAAVLSCGIVYHEESLSRARAFFEQRNLEFADNNRKQATVPEASHVFVNPAGLAPGFRFLHHGCSAYCLPGVPRELKALWHQEVWPDIVSRSEGLPPGAYRILKLFGVPESYLARDVADLIDSNPDVTFGFRAHYPEVWLKFRVPGVTLESAGERADGLAAEVAERFGHRLFGREEETMESVVLDGLLARGLTLATAESCTGGMIGTRLTSIPGSSEAYLGGGITYSNGLKQQLLGVPDDVLANHGAVSEECARAMAEGARRNFQSDLAVSVTGIAGPGGGSAEKPVGTVHFALASPDQTYHQVRTFRPEREAVRVAAATTALNLVRRYLLGLLK